MPRICVVTLLIGDLSYKETAKNNHQTYCDLHDYTYVCVEEKLNDFHPMWMKPDLLLHYLEKGYDHVLWMDGDSFFINMNTKLEKFTDKEVDFIGTGDMNDIVNTGHVLLRNSEWSKQFLRNWIAFRQPLDDDTLFLFKQVTTHFTHYEGKTYFNDQPPVNLILGGADPTVMNGWFAVFNKVNFYEGNGFRENNSDCSPICEENLERTHSLISENVRDHVCIVTQSEMNAYPSTYKEGDFIVHFAEGNKGSIPTLVPSMVTHKMSDKDREFDESLYNLEDCKKIQEIVSGL